MGRWESSRVWKGEIFRVWKEIISRKEEGRDLKGMGRGSPRETVGESLREGGMGRALGNKMGKALGKARGKPLGYKKWAQGNRKGRAQGRGGERSRRGRGNPLETERT